MMLEFLGWRSEAAALRTAVRAALRENCVTPDLGGSKRTAEMGDCWWPNLSKLSPAALDLESALAAGRGSYHVGPLQFQIST